jgi:hypothetical protein
MPYPHPFNHNTAPRSHTRLIGDQCERCLYCRGLRITREGKRYKKLETIQLWRCHACNRVFTPQIAKGKTFPLAVILDALMRYYRGDTRERVATHIKERFGLDLSPRTLSQWLAEYRELTTYARLRPALLPQFRPHQLIRSTRLHHQQVYHYRIHQGKLAYLLSQAEHEIFRPIETYLTEMATSCPHPLFQQEHRASASAPDSSDTWFQRACMHIADPYHRKALHTQGVIHTYLQDRRDRLRGRFLRLALRQCPHDIGCRAQAGRGQAPLPGGPHRPPLLALPLRERCLGLGPPAGHSHTSGHRESRRQRSTGLLPLAGRGLQRAQPAVAVGHERAHAERVGAGEGLAVARVGLCALRGIAMRRTGTEEAQGIRCIPSCLGGLGLLQGTGGKRVRRLQAAGVSMRLAPDGALQHA